MLYTLQTLGWLACVVYATIPSFWLMIHPHAAYWRSRAQSPYRVLIPLWIGMWMVVGLLTAPGRRIGLYHTAWAWLPASFLFALGIWLYRRAGATFTPRQLRGFPELRIGPAEQRLVTTGIHAHVRHPVYLAHLCEMLAWSIGTGLTVCYGLTAFAIVTGGFMLPMEDTELEQRFGDPYCAYKDSVPAIFPKFTQLHSRL
jgi:protein-S-isoprenylcysteine O-methyltransferase Ste14